MKTKSRTKRALRIVAIVLALAVVGLGIYFKRTIGLRNALSYDYWMTRLHGHEFYNPETRYFKRGSRDYKDLLLTIDDAPHRKSMPLILSVLKEEQVPALFFVIGKNVKKEPELTREILADGNEIGNHTQDHIRLTTLKTEKQVRNEILNCQTNVIRATGHTMTFIRPPGMDYNDTVLKVAKQYGYVFVGWSLGAKDFIPTIKDNYTEAQIKALKVSPEEIVQRVLKQVQSGSIILLHDNPVTGRALKSIIDQLKAQGYTFVSCVQMLAKLNPPVIVEANPVAKR